VDQYATAVKAATGKQVTVQNLSRHDNLTLPRLVDELDGLEQQLSAADVILVGIAHNSFELNADAPCGRPVVDGAPDWSVVDAACAEESAARDRPMYEALYSRIRRWREGRPTLLRTVNRYNDWIGSGLTPTQDLQTATMLDAWNTMLCTAAQANWFGCADVHHAFNGPKGTTAVKDFLSHDSTHPSQRGNDTLTRLLQELGFAPLT